MTNGIHSSRIARFVAPAGVLFALSVSVAAGAETPSARTHLFRVSVPDRGLVVFLPESEIASESDAVAYLRWARETFPKETKDDSLDVVWASDGVALRAPQQDDVHFLRPGDDALDASGRVAFRVKATTNGTDVVLCLKGLPEPGTATPELCLTNAWVLSREHLKGRFANDLKTDPVAVREDIKALHERFRKEPKADVAEAWLSDLYSFVSNTPALWPAIRATNRTDRPVAVSIGGRPAEILAAGEARSIPLDSWPAGEKVSWSARDAGGGLCDKDFSAPAKGELKWDALAASDLPLPLKGSLGDRLPRPRLRLPSILPVSLSKDGADAMRVFVGYDGQSGEPVPTKVLVGADGKPEIEIEPHRAVRSLRVEADGWEPLAAEVNLPGVCSAGEPRSVPLDGRTMVPHAEPWPTLVVRNESGAPAVLRSNELFGKGECPVAAGSSTNIVLNGISSWGPDLEDGSSIVWPIVVSERKVVLVAVVPGMGGELLATNLAVCRGGEPIELAIHAPVPKPAPVADGSSRDSKGSGTVRRPISELPSITDINSMKELPSITDINSMKEWLNGVKRRAIGTNDQQKNEIEKAKPKLQTLVKFWMADYSPQFSKDDIAMMETFGRVVAHLAECPGCDSCKGLLRRKPGLASTLDPKTEAFEVLIAWGDEDEGMFPMKKKGQRTYRKELLERLGADAAWPFSDDDPKKADDRKSSCAAGWAWIIRASLGGDSKKEDRTNARRFWNGESDGGKVFRRAYIHLELCDDAACPCAPYRSALRRAPTFDERRKALLAAFACDGKLFEGKSEKFRPLSADERDHFVKSMQTEENRNERQ